MWNLLDCIKVIFKKFKKELTHTNQILGSHKERMKSIKEHKIFKWRIRWNWKGSWTESKGTWGPWGFCQQPRIAVASKYKACRWHLTSKRLLFCLDSNDLTALSLEREGEGGKRSIKLYDEEDIKWIREFLKMKDAAAFLLRMYILKIRKL